jgi:hypothetical protein
LPLLQPNINNNNPTIKNIPQYGMVAIVTLAKDIPTIKHSQQ